MDMLNGFMASIRPQKDGDMVDRLSYYYSVIVLVVCSVFVSGWSFVGQPIQCWFPAYYRGWWIEYALDYCYVQNTYFIPFNRAPPKNYWELSNNVINIPQNVTEREDKLIGYYQWVPFVLAIEAILFYLPIVIWRHLYSHSGLKVATIMEVLTDTDNMTPETRRKNIGKVAKFMDHSISITEHMHGVRSFFAGRYVSLVYIFVKILFAANCVLQFFMLQGFLGLNESWWGISVVSDLIGGRTWQESGHFPRVTLCDFEVRVLGNLHRHTVQCVLLINMFNEKIFIVLWFWFLMVGFFSILSLLYWIATSVTARTGQHIIENYLERIDPKSYQSSRRRQLIHQFLQERLKSDGVFLLRLIGSNAGDVVCSELIDVMWNDYKKKYEQNNGGLDDLTPPPPSVTVATAPPLKDYPTLPLRDRNYPYPPSYEQSHL